MDGLSKPSDIVNRCNQIGVRSCAITDHGNISGAVQFYQQTKSNNIKPILGCELYISHKDSEIKEPSNSNLSHFVVLAKNYDGWKTLIKIVSESNKPSNFYHKPRLDIEKLSKLLDGNIIGICGHLGSYIADIALQAKSSTNQVLIDEVCRMKDIFGIDNFSRISTNG